MRKQFLVALHVYNREQVLEEVKKVLTAGAHGVLLVNNGGYIASNQDDYPNLFDITVEVKEKYPDYIVGINPLDLTIENSFNRTYDEIDRKGGKNPFDILWVDNGGIKENAAGAFIEPAIKNNFGQFGLQNRFSVKYYGGIAFKYQVPPKNLAAVAGEAAKYFSAVITSGEATGKQADPKKIRVIKSFIGDVPLGIASGLTERNVELYVKYTDIFIVGTSLLIDPTNQFVYSAKKVDSFRVKLEQNL